MQYPSMQIPPRLPLVIDPLNRDDTTNKDARLVNAYVEYAQGTEPWIFKRPGLLLQAVVNSNNVGMGLFTWNNNVYSLWGDGTIYKNGLGVPSSPIGCQTVSCVKPELSRSGLPILLLQLPPKIGVHRTALEKMFKN